MTWSLRGLLGLRPVPEPDLARAALAGEDRRFRVPRPSGGAVAAVLARRGPSIRDVFTPTRPKEPGPTFVGRDAAVSRLREALEDERAHVVLFGARGRGKTSLINVYLDGPRAAGWTVVHLSGSAETRFDDLFRPLLVAVAERERVSGPDASPLRPADVVAALRRSPRHPALLVIDEYDRIGSEAARDGVAETLKALSDAGLPVGLVLVGVAETLQDLVGRHPSAQRNVVGLHLPPMTREELAAIVQGGAEASGLRFDARTTLLVAALSLGQPYNAQLLCLRAARAAEARGSTLVEAADLAGALSLADRGPARAPDGGDRARLVALAGAALAGLGGREFRDEDAEAALREVFGPSFPRPPVDFGSLSGESCELALALRPAGRFRLVDAPLAEAALWRLAAEWLVPARPEASGPRALGGGAPPLRSVPDLPGRVAPDALVPVRPRPHPADPAIGTARTSDVG